MKFCSNCGKAVEQRIPEGDDRPRYVCAHCSTIHYQNPKIVVGCVAVHGDRVLLCRRAIEPRHGFWTLPAGFMERGESTQQGALRETWEEARARVENESFYRMFDLPHINQVYMFYRGDLVNGEYGVGPESLESTLFTEAEIPWHDIAFPVMVETLREFFEDRKNGHFPVRATKLPAHWHEWWKRQPRG